MRIEPRYWCTPATNSSAGKSPTMQFVEGLFTDVKSGLADIWLFAKMPGSNWYSGRFARHARQGSTFAPQFVTGRFLRGGLSGRVPEQHVRVSVRTSRVAFLHRTDKQDLLSPVVQRFGKRVPKTERIGLQRERKLAHEESVRDRIHVMPHSVQRMCAWTRDVHPGTMASGTEMRCVPGLPRPHELRGDKPARPVFPSHRKSRSQGIRSCAQVAGGR